MCVLRKAFFGLLVMFTIVVVSCTKVDISPTDDIKFAIDSFIITNNHLLVNGWAFNVNNKEQGGKIYLVFKSEEKVIVKKTISVSRPDVKRVYSLNYVNSGFRLDLNLNELKKIGIYEVGIYMKNKKQKSLVYIPRKITKLKSGILLSDVSTNISVTLPQTESGNYRCDLKVNENFEDGKVISVYGWAVITNENYISENPTIYVVLKSQNNQYVFPTKVVKRPDVTKAIGQGKYNLDNSGYSTFIAKELIKPDIYMVGLYIVDGEKECLFYTKNIIQIEEK